MGKAWENLTDELLRRLNSIADVAKLKSFPFHTDDTAAGSTMRPNLTEYAIEESLEFTFGKNTQRLKESHQIPSVIGTEGQRGPNLPQKENFCFSLMFQELENQSLDGQES
ncbi:hypothetical protein SCAR479_02587 [Seiridium cardinale]|uniref:Uncharacterized protein n=1 Tax=Seiridium cardinale TaxID=138064 RepID=A0ABR2Y312_9PEZI